VWATKKELVARAVMCGLVLACFFLCAAVLAARSDASRDDASLAYNTSNLIRLHVVAPADDGASSCLKLTVRDEILDEASVLLEGAKNVREAEACIRANLDEIERKANEVVRRAGFSYPVRITLGKNQFPSVSYGRTSLPAGEYLSLSAAIGPAEGSNWWCVLFPPLCLVDVAQGCIIEAERRDGEFVGVELATRSLLRASTSAQTETALYEAAKAARRTTLAQLNWELPPWICRLLGMGRFDQAQK
jgi:stage II sporulation protein R